MFCRPARSSRATNGVVFQTSASTTGTQARPVWMNQTGGSRTTRRSTRSALAMPARPSKMKRQSSADTTVGMAHGTSTAARTQGAPAKRAVHRERQQAAEPELDGDCRDGEQQRVREGFPEAGVAAGPRGSWRPRRTAGRARACADRADGPTPRASRAAGRGRRAEWSRGRARRATRRGGLRGARRGCGTPRSVVTARSDRTPAPTSPSTGPAALHLPQRRGPARRPAPAAG